MLGFKSKKPKAYRSVLTVYLYKGGPLETSASIPELGDFKLPWLKFITWFVDSTRDDDAYEFSDGNALWVVKFGSISHYEISVEDVK